MKPEILETISIEKQSEIVYLNIKNAYESGMTHWKEALLVSWRDPVHPMVKEHVKFLIIQENKKIKKRYGNQNK